MMVKFTNSLIFLLTRNVNALGSLLRQISFLKPWMDPERYIIVCTTNRTNTAGKDVLPLWEIKISGVSGSTFEYTADALLKTRKMDAKIHRTPESIGPLITLHSPQLIFCNFLAFPVSSSRWLLHSNSLSKSTKLGIPNSHSERPNHISRVRW